MQQSCWAAWTDRGFLISPDPATKLIEIDRLNTLMTREALEQLDDLSASLPALLEGRRVRQTLNKLPVYDLTPLRADADAHLIERLMQLYCYLASAYVYATYQDAEHRIPAGVAVPLYELSRMVERPPILTYTSYVLANWVRPVGAGIEVDQLDLAQPFLGVGDEKWFILIHVDIEARAAGALQGIQSAKQAVERDDAAAVERGLQDISASLSAMLTTFDRMPEGCNSDVYYFRVRPYIFGFNEVIYEGVEAFGGKPQSFRGQTGAQSSIIPALVAGLGLKHEQSALTQHLEVMKAYMPRPHREFIAEMGTAGIRNYVLRSESKSLAEAYNTCLRQVLAFRKLHLHYATTYIAQKVKNPLGTGGTVFMDWLDRLATETEAQLVEA
jgi:indoleamine 2,3-dioxygenase